MDDLLGDGEGDGADGTGHSSSASSSSTDIVATPPTIPKDPIAETLYAKVPIVHAKTRSMIQTTRSEGGWRSKVKGWGRRTT